VSCLACGEADSLEIYRSDAVRVWTDTSDDDSITTTHRCGLRQCRRCGHVFQPVDDELREILEEIYRSQNAQGSTPMGAGAWGLDRVNRLVFSELDLRDHRSALEIGCGDGYVLSRLRERGFQRLVGIEPSVNAGEAEAGITILRDFVDENSDLGERFDLIYSVAVFEHIERLRGVLEFCRKHLSATGELFFVVPNAQEQLESGDPGLFVHQHLHYFTEKALRNLLGSSGFGVVSIVARKEAFFVTARRGAQPYHNDARGVAYDDYQRKLDLSIERMQELTAGGGLVVHAACNALNNVADQLTGEFILADNDEIKQGKRYFGRTVVSPAALDLGKVRAVLAMAHPFFESIRDGYVRRGYSGPVVSPVTLLENTHN
jgi:SAM-dependent methyltransferase